ncbi:MAG: hypothetical protein OT477_01540 [Chloroflexi bacterium]|nr:hypothetical protein [Chloroflexota bacterium]
MTNTPSPIQTGRPESHEEEVLRQWWNQQRLEGVDNLEKMAREIIGLVTGLLGLLLGVLAVAEDPLPTYLQQWSVRGLGIAAIVAFLVALGTALVVIYPRPWSDLYNQPEAQKAQFDQLLNGKSYWLKWSMRFFGAGVACLGVGLVLVLFIAT